MKRIAESHLKAWWDSSDRMPLIIRGARQVGKSTLVRLFCQTFNLDLIEFNFERENLNSIQKENFSLQELLDEIQIRSKKIITPNTLIFFDEIQESPKLIKWLRYFYEERPDIAVISAGSLLEIALSSEKFSFPVGRVQFYHLGPMTFSEFLYANGNALLAKKIENLDFSAGVHEMAKEEFRRFLYVGGMPKAIATYVKEKSLVNVRNIQEQILQTYEADFPKYHHRIQVERIGRIFASVVLHLGKKIIYQHLDRSSKSREIRKIVELLIDARLLIPCIHSDANTIPLAGESDSSIQKIYFLDIGLLNCLLRLDIDTIDVEFKNNFNTKGIIAEQFVAQHLSYIHGNKIPPELYYWLRDKGSQKGEIDFIIQTKQKIIPIEIKAVKSGRLKSLFYFINEKKSKTVIKVSLDKFRKENIAHKIEGNIIGAELINLPHFAIEQILKVIP